MPLLYTTPTPPHPNRGPKAIPRSHRRRNRVDGLLVLLLAHGDVPPRSTGADPGRLQDAAGRQPSGGAGHLDDLCPVGIRDGQVRAGMTPSAGAVGEGGGHEQAGGLRLATATGICGSLAGNSPSLLCTLILIIHSLYSYSSNVPLMRQRALRIPVTVCPTRGGVRGAGDGGPSQSGGYMYNLAGGEGKRGCSQHSGTIVSTILILPSVLFSPPDVINIPPCFPTHHSDSEHVR